jgi:hypothetical protein
MIGAFSSQRSAPKAVFQRYRLLPFSYLHTLVLGKINVLISFKL